MRVTYDLLMAAFENVDRNDALYRLRDVSRYWADQVTQWTEAGTKHTEKSFAQSFWSDLLGCFGINAARQDLFERDANRASTGNTGYIDVFWSGVFIGETKSLGANLDKAHQQALDYLAGGSIGNHEFPKYVIVTDFARIRVDRLGDEPWTSEFGIVDAPDHIDELLFLAGYETITRAEQQDASIHAAQLMAELYAAMVGEDADEAVGDDAPTDAGDEDEHVQNASIFLTRILFLLYGDDAGLWEADLFYRWVDQSTTVVSLGPQLAALFDVLNRPDRSKRMGDLLGRFPYVNGSLFDKPLPLNYFTRDMRDALLAACRFRWTRISPAIFGAMFQLVKSREARRAAGEHYTSEDNILKTIGPLFLDEYRDRADRLIRNKSTTPAQLAAFQDELAANIYVDPACGSGNFLNLAYARLRAIETDIIVERRRRIGETGMSLDATFEQKLTIDRFYGFEINWWPAKIAETAMFLVDHQANRALAQAVGQAPDRLPIKITAHITHADALELDWNSTLPEVAGRTWVFGNPPFRGDARTAEQKRALQNAWGSSVQLSRIDFVTGWHAKTLRLLEKRPGAFAYVTTNSITQGDQPPRLFGAIFSAGWRIAFAHRTFAWNSQAPGGAAVHCVIVGFTRNKDVKQRFWTYSTPKAEATEVGVNETINAYLVDGPDVLVRKRSKMLSPTLSKSWRGSMPSDDGNLLVSVDEYELVMSDPIAAKYVHPYVGAQELLHNDVRWCLWLDGIDPAELSRSKVLHDRVEAVREFRGASKAASTREYPHHHLFRQLAKRDNPFVCIPRHVSENRRYFTVALLDSEVIAGDANFTIEDPTGLQFALLSSSMFREWLATIGGRLESRFRFGSTLVWYTFPVPALDEKTRAAIIQAGQHVLAARELHPERSLADAYNPLAMDPALVKAHDRLDAVVDKAMGAPRKLSNERQRLEILFARYSELTEAESG